MIICSCNCIRACQIDDAIADGAKTACQVYARCGGEQCCGLCRPEIEDRIEDAAQTCYAIAAE